MLFETGKVITKGYKSSVRYFIATKNTLKLSDVALNLKQQVQQPLQARKPVSYNVGFLYQYQPNHSYYLPEKVRSHLMSVGQRVGNDLEPSTYVKMIYHRSHLLMSRKRTT